jgi:hypothetical protein
MRNTARLFVDQAKHIAGTVVVALEWRACKPKGAHVIGQGALPHRHVRIVDVGRAEDVVPDCWAKPRV